MNVEQREEREFERLSLPDIVLAGATLEVGVRGQLSRAADPAAGRRPWHALMQGQVEQGRATQSRVFFFGQAGRKATKISGGEFATGGYLQKSALDLDGRGVGSAHQPSGVAMAEAPSTESSRTGRTVGPVLESGIVVGRRGLRAPATVRSAVTSAASGAVVASAVCSTSKVRVERRGRGKSEGAVRVERRRSVVLATVAVAEPEWPAVSKSERRRRRTVVVVVRVRVREMRVRRRRGWAWALVLVVRVLSLAVLVLAFCAKDAVG